MTFEREDGYNISESGNWNVAADYSKLKIMKPLNICDTYEDIAKFGYESILDQLINFSIPNDIIRLTGFERLVQELLKLIKNSKFALKVKGTLKDIEKHEKKLKQINNIIPNLSKITKTRKGKITKIHEENYNKVLDLVLEIKSKINEPLNKNHLIFTDKEEFDPVAYKKQLIENITNRG